MMYNNDEKTFINFMFPKPNASWKKHNENIEKVDE